MCWVAPVWHCGRADQSTANSANSNCQRGDHSVDESNDDRVSVFKLAKMISIHIYVYICIVGQVAKQKIWNFEKCIYFLCYMDQYKDCWQAMDKSCVLSPSYREAVRIFRTSPDRFLNSSWHCVIG